MLSPFQGSHFFLWQPSADNGNNRAALCQICIKIKGLKKGFFKSKLIFRPEGNCLVSRNPLFLLFHAVSLLKSADRGTKLSLPCLAFYKSAYTF